MDDQIPVFLTGVVIVDEDEITIHLSADNECLDQIAARIGVGAMLVFNPPADSEEPDGAEAEPGNAPVLTHPRFER